MYAILEEAIVDGDAFYPSVVCEANVGKILTFKTKEEAEEYMREERQEGQIIEVAEKSRF